MNSVQAELIARDVQCQTPVWLKILLVQQIVQSTVERTKCNALEDGILQEDAQCQILVSPWRQIAQHIVLYIVLKEIQCAPEELIPKDAKCQTHAWLLQIAQQTVQSTVVKMRCIVQVAWIPWDVQCLTPVSR